MSQFWKVTRLATLGYVALVAPAYAYVDPGTASLLIQGIIGAVAGGLVAIKLYWSRLKRAVQQLVRGFKG